MTTHTESKIWDGGLADLTAWFVPGWSIGYLAVGAWLVQLGLGWPQLILAALFGTTFAAGITGLLRQLMGQQTEPGLSFGHVQAVVLGVWTVVLTGFFVGYGSLLGGALLSSLDWSISTVGALICLVIALGATALLLSTDEEFRFWLRFAFSLLVIVLVAAVFYGIGVSPSSLDHGPTASTLLGFGLVVVTSTLWLPVAATPAGPTKSTSGWTRALPSSIGPLVTILIGAVASSASEQAMTRLVANPATGLANLVVTPFLVPALAVCVITQIAFTSANVAVIERSLTHFGVSRGGKWIALILIGLFSTATIFGQEVMEQILMQVGIVFAAFVGVLLVSLLLPSRTNTLAFAAFFIGAGAGIAVTVFWESQLNMTWIIGTATAFAVGAIGAVVSRFVVGPRKAKDVVTAEEESAEAEVELSPGDLLAARADVPADVVEETIDDLVAPLSARGVSAPDNADLENWATDAERGLVGVFRAEKFDESQHELASQTRPSRAMSQEEQDELEAWLEDTGTISKYVDDGSTESPARPRRVLIEDD